MNQDNNLPLGYMIVRVTTARGAIPLEGATVLIQAFPPDGTEGKGDVIAAYNTNSSGLTPKIELQAPSRELSLTPGNGKSYSTYTLTVNAPGYQPRTYINVPVFEGITAIQNADMIPLPENGQTDRFDPRAGITLEIENPYLESKREETP